MKIANPFIKLFSIQKKHHNCTLKLFFIYFLIIFNLLFSSELIPPSSHIDWEILQDYPIWIGWTDYGKFQWCMALSTIAASIEDVQNIIEDKKNYPIIFKRIEKTTLLSDEIVHIVLDMPFPFYGRDYIVSYTQFQEENDIVYRFIAVEDPGIPLHEDYIRLKHAAGEWRLHSLGSSNTEVTYIWNGELLGDFPNWALTRAWKTQGQEVLTWLKNAVE